MGYSTRCNVIAHVFQAPNDSRLSCIFTSNFRLVFHLSHQFLFYFILFCVTFTA